MLRRLQPKQNRSLPVRWSSRAAGISRKTIPMSLTSIAREARRTLLPQAAEATAHAIAVVIADVVDVPAVVADVDAGAVDAAVAVAADVTAADMAVMVAAEAGTKTASQIRPDSADHI